MCRSIPDKDCNEYLASYSYGSPVDSSSSYSSASNSPEPEASIPEETPKLSAKSVSAAPKKQYQCPQCHKNFSRPSALQTHSYTHTSEKPFQCLSPGCGRRFSVVSNLRRHFKVHQKPTVSDKISSEDRLRYVRQLIKSSNAILAKQKEVYDNQQSHKDAVPQFSAYPKIHPYPTTPFHGEERRNNEQNLIASTSSPNRYHHYILLPAINNNNYNNVPLPNNYAPVASNYLTGNNYEGDYLESNTISDYYHHQQPTSYLSSVNQSSSPEQEHGPQFTSYYSYVDDKNDVYDESPLNYYP